MSSFDDTKDAILRDAKQNGGLNERSLFNLIVASHDDAQKADIAFDEKLDKHVEEDRLQFARISSHLESEAGTLSRAVTRITATVDDRGERIKNAKTEILAEVDKLIAAAATRAPRRATDPPDEVWAKPLPVAAMAPPEDEQLGDIRRLWRVGRWAAMLAGAACILFATNYYADSCASSRAETAAQHGETTTLATTASPAP